MLTGVITLEELHLIYMPTSQHLLFAVLRGSREAERLLWAGHQPTPIYMLGALRFWTDVPAHFTALKLPLPSTMLNSVITIVEAPLRQSSFQDKSALLGRVLPEPPILISLTFRTKPNIHHNPHLDLRPLYHHKS